MLPDASMPRLLSDGPEPLAVEDVAPGLSGPGDLFGEPRQQRLDSPIRPFEEYLRDQVIRGRVAVVSNESVRDLHLTPPIDIEGSERNAETPREPSAVPHR